MTLDEFEAFARLTLKRCEDLRSVKKNEYSRDQDDRLSHFKLQARDIGIHPLALWQVLAGKHWMAVTDYVKQTQLGNTLHLSEPIDGRFQDLINYLLLGAALSAEREEPAVHGSGEVAEVPRETWNRLVPRTMDMDLMGSGTVVIPPRHPSPRSSGFPAELQQRAPIVPVQTAADYSDRPAPRPSIGD